MSRPFDPEKRDVRFSPVPLGTLYEMHRVDGHWSLLFDIAAAEGTAVKADGTTAKPFPGERYIGVWVGQVHRRRIVGRIGITDRQWNRAAKTWVELQLAHRCDRKGIFVYLQPSATCLRCLIRGRSASPQEDVLRLAAGPDASLATHEQREPQQGEEEGNGLVPGRGSRVPDREGSEVPGRQEGVKKSAALRENEAAPLTADEAWARLHPDETRETG